MESLLTPAFDNVLSKTPKRISKGLRQIQGILAQICLAAPSTARNAELKSASRRSRNLQELNSDPVYIEFYRSQESFEWNVATNLIDCIENVLGMGDSAENDAMITSALELLQGVLLLHPPSRALFRRTRNMTLLLDLLAPTAAPHLIAAALLVLVSALLGQPANTRVFERCHGIATLTSLSKARETTEEIRSKITEFFYFYLMPEAPELNQNGARMGTSAVLGPDSKSRSDHLSASTTSQSSLAQSTASFADTQRLSSAAITTAEKQILLSKYFSGVDHILQDLKASGAVYAC